MVRLTLALDVMGGDIGPRVTIPAISLALAHHPHLHCLLFGDESLAQPYLAQLPQEQRHRIQFVHTDLVIADDLPFKHALRHSKGSSMRLAIEAVQHKQAQAAISGGNTAVLMGLAKLLIKPISSIQRPALTSLVPTINGRSTVMLDLGANVEADEAILLQFSEMGNVFAQKMLNLVYPRIGLLNIGVEENKGTPVLKQTHQRLKQRHDLNYHGFLESDKLMNDVVDVIVCDGFSGNIALKSLEGAAKNILAMVRTAKPDSDWFRKLKHAFYRLIFRRFYQKLQLMNPDRHNGATLLGLESVIVKSHGSANVNAFFYAIEFAISQVAHEIPQQLAATLAPRSTAS